MIIGVISFSYKVVAVRHHCPRCPLLCLKILVLDTLHLAPVSKHYNIEQNLLEPVPLQDRIHGSSQKHIAVAHEIVQKVWHLEKILSVCLYSHLRPI